MDLLDLATAIGAAIVAVLALRSPLHGHDGDQHADRNDRNDRHD